MNILWITKLTDATCHKTSEFELSEELRKKGHDVTIIMAKKIGQNISDNNKNIYLPTLDFNDMHQKFTHQNRLTLMAVWKNNNSIDKSNIKVRNGEVTNVGEPDSKYIDYGVTVMRKNALKIVPTNQPFSTKSFWTKLSNMHELAAYEVTERFYHIGNREGLDELITFIAEKKNKRT